MPRKDAASSTPIQLARRLGGTDTTTAWIAEGQPTSVPVIAPRISSPLSSVNVGCDETNDQLQDVAQLRLLDVGTKRGTVRHVPHRLCGQRCAGEEQAAIDGMRMVFEAGMPPWNRHGLGKPS